MDAHDYCRLTIAELAAAAYALAAEIREAKSRTPDERAALARKCVMLLIGMARTIEPSPYVPHKPENHLRPDDMVRAFAAWSKHQCDAARHHTMRRAAEFAFGKRAKEYFRVRLQWDIHDGVAVDVMTGSDEALLRTLLDMNEQRKLMLGSPAQLRALDPNQKA
jgi:hypothetical protein